MTASASPQDDPARESPPALLHVDLDGARDIYRAHGWNWPWPDDPIFETGMRNLLDLLDARGLRATLFAISSSLDDPRKRSLLEEAVARGHEIASHTDTHPDLRTLTTADKRRELAASRERLEKELGTPVRGFRAPGYSIDRETIELLPTLGYAWDSSAVRDADFAGRLGTTAAALERPGFPFAGGSGREGRAQHELLELPLPCHRPLPFPWSASYVLLLGRPWFHLGYARERRRGEALVVLLHLTDLADPLPRERAGSLAARAFTVSLRGRAAKRRTIQHILDAVGRDYRWAPTEALVESLLRRRRQEAP